MSGLPYEQPAGLEGQVQLGAATLPKYQVFVLLLRAARLLSWSGCAHPDQGRMIVRAATEDADRAGRGISVGAVGGAGLRLRHRAGRTGGVLRRADPGVNPLHGSDLIIAVFDGGGDRRPRIDLRCGRRRIRASDWSGVRAGLRRPLSSVAIFILMAAIILVRPAGLFGRAESA